MKKVIIFDMDGTILDSGDAIATTINTMRKKCGMNALLDKEFIIKTINNPAKDYILEFYGEMQITSRMRELFELEFVTNYHKFAKLYAGIEDLLKKCKEEGYYLALASNAPSIMLKGILQKNGVLELFDAVVGSDHGTPEKPDPAMIFKVMDMAKSKNALFIGDSIKDKSAAINAKCGYLQVTWGFGTKFNDCYNAQTPEKAWEIIKKFEIKSN